MGTLHFICRLALPVGLLIGAINGAAAQVSEAARQACTPDAMRLCSEFVPDAAKVKNCMMRRRSELSAPCIAAMRAMGRGRHEHYRRVRHVVHHYRHYYRRRH